MAFARGEIMRRCGLGSMACVLGMAVFCWGQNGPPGRTERVRLEQYRQRLEQARAAKVDVREAERLQQLSQRAARAGDMAEADRLLNQAVAELARVYPAGASGASTGPASREPSGKADSSAGPALRNGGAPVFFLPFTHHYDGPGGYYASAAEVRAMGELLVRYKVPGTLFFDGILVERLQREDPSLIRQIREWNLPLGYHGEETHGPYPVASELLGEVYELREAQGYKGPWSLTTGKGWSDAVKAVTARYSHAMPWTIDETSRMLDRHRPSETDLSRKGGLALVQEAFGRDVSMMPSHALESAPEGYAFRRMSHFGFDQPAVPLALHALRIFRIAESADRVMRIGGAGENVFWHMGRLTCKGDEAAEASFHLGGLRATLTGLDRSKPRLLLMGISRVNEAEFARAVQYLERDFFPANPGSGWVTGESLPSFFEGEKAWTPSRSDARETASAVAATWGARPPDLVVLPGRTLSLCDAFELLVRFWASGGLAGEERETVSLHPLYGPVAEDGKSLLAGPVKVAAASIRAAAIRIAAGWDRTAEDRFVPALVTLPEGGLNAAEFLLAMARGVQAAEGEPVSVVPSSLFPSYADTLQAVFKPRAAQPLCYTQGQLWTVKPARLAGAGLPAAAPAGDSAKPATGTVRVVFAANLDGTAPCTRDSPWGADLYQADFHLATGKASGLKRLTRGAGAEWFPALSPDGVAVVYEAMEPGGAPGRPGRRALRRILPASGDDEEILREARFPAFSADGASLFFSRQTGGTHTLLRAPVSNAGGYQPGPERVLVDSAALGAALVEDPSPLADGSGVVFHWKKADSPGAGVASAGANGRECQALTPFDGCGHAAVSPDGKTVACTRSRDGRLVLIRREAGAWGEPRDLSMSGAGTNYATLDERFLSVRELRHSYVEWVGPDLLLSTVHGADGAREFRFARLLLLRLREGESPEIIDLSRAIEALAGRTGRDFCTASGRLINQDSPARR
jgi:hypothetical protein